MSADRIVPCPPEDPRACFEVPAPGWPSAGEPVVSHAFHSGGEPGSRCQCGSQEIDSDGVSIPSKAAD